MVNHRRIGIDARSLKTPHIGVGRYVSNLLRHIARSGRSSEYLLLLDGKTDDIPKGFGSIELKSSIIHNNLYWMNFVLPMGLAREKIGLFHAPFYGLPFMQPCPMVFTCHDIIFEKHPEWYPPATRWAFQMLSRRAAKTAKKIIADSDQTKNDLISLYGVDEKRIEVIYLAPDDAFKPVDKSAARQRLRERYGIDERFLLYVGAISPRRNLKTLLMSYSSLLKKVQDVKLVVVGTELKGHAGIDGYIDELGLKDKVIRLGDVPQDDLNDLYNCAELFVYPSIYEGFGLPLVEAMACGTPILSSNVSVMPEVVGNAGKYFDPYDVNGLADSIAQIIDNSALKTEMSQKSILRAADFSWQETAAKTVKIYDDILEAGQ